MLRLEHLVDLLAEASSCLGEAPLPPEIDGGAWIGQSWAAADGSSELTPAHGRAP